jgi:hypothetical protein
MQGILGIPLSKYFPNYDAEYLKTRLGGYSKAFDEYYVFRMTHILNLMRRELGIRFENESFDDDVKNRELETSILTEYFIVFLQVLMDQLAVFMPFFYSNQNKHESLIIKKQGVFIDRFKSFAQVKYIYIKNEEIDQDLSIHMKTNMSWFDDINAIRNSLIHGSGWLWFEYGHKSRDPKFKNVSGYLMKKEWFPSIKDFMAKSYYNFMEFLLFYENHFRSKCEMEFKEFEYIDRPHWFTPDSPFYKTMDYFYEEGKKLSICDSAL